MDNIDFYKHFQQTIATIEDKITDLPNDDTRSDYLRECTASITALSDAVRDIVDSLPSRDRQTYLGGIKALSTKLDLVQTPTRATKQKFSFKSSFKPSQKASTATEQIAVSVENIVTSSITSRHSESINTRPEDLALIADVDDCIISLRSSCSLPTLRLRAISSSIVLLPRVKGPLYLKSLTDCIIIASCHQFRMHESRGCEVYLYCSSRPIIEDCKSIQFAPTDYNSFEINRWDEVDDFSWLRNERNPNWSILEIEDRRDIDRFAQLPLKELSTVIDSIGSR